MEKKRKMSGTKFSFMRGEVKKRAPKNPIKIKEGWEEELKRQTGIEKQKDR